MSDLRPTREDIARYSMTMLNLFQSRGFQIMEDFLVEKQCYDLSNNGSKHGVLIHPSKVFAIDTEVDYTILHGTRVVVPLRLRINPAKMVCPISVACDIKPAEDYSRIGSDGLNNSIWRKHFPLLGLEIFYDELRRLAKG